MRLLRLFSILIFLLSGLIVNAQTSLDPNSNKGASKSTSKFYSPKRTTYKQKKVKVTRTAQYEFYKRVEKASKDKQRIMRKLSKPQFSNPAYFGHKRKPKKRATHRMRFCSECHIRH